MNIYRFQRPYRRALWQLEAGNALPPAKEARRSIAEAFVMGHGVDHEVFVLRQTTAPLGEKTQASRPLALATMRRVAAVVDVQRQRLFLIEHAYAGRVRTTAEIRLDQMIGDRPVEAPDTREGRARTGQDTATHRLHRWPRLDDEAGIGIEIVVQAQAIRRHVRMTNRHARHTLGGGLEQPIEPVVQQSGPQEHQAHAARGRRTKVIKLAEPGASRI